MRKSKKILLILMVLLQSMQLSAVDWQWSVIVNGPVSSETKMRSRAFLWIPPHCKQVRTVVFGMHNMIEEGIFEDPYFRQSMSDLGFAVVWVTPMLDMPWDVNSGVQKSFDQMLNDLAEVSGYKELRYAPVVPLGHSAAATFPWNFAAWNPDRTLAILSVHGDAPQTNLTGYGRKNMDWDNRTVDGVPGLMVEGEFEWWEARVNPALAYRKAHPQSPVSFLCDAGRGHFDYSDGMIHYLCLFLKKAAEYRLPAVSPEDGPVALKPVNPADGWLCDRWRLDGIKRAAAAPYSKYRGNKDDAFWYFDKEIALATENYYAKMRGKKLQYIGFMQDGHLLGYNTKSHVRSSAQWEQEADGLTFHLKAAYTDTLRQYLSDEHASTPPSISRICGPVIKINDTTFSVRFYRMGLNNERRTGDIYLLGMNDGDDHYKSSVQELNLHIPMRNTVGIAQHITFAPLPDVLKGTPSLPLNGTSDSGMPVYYYVQEGPAEVKDGLLYLTEIPARAKFPIKVTVVAWQYGRSVEPKVQTAEPVVRSFYIVNKFDNSLIDHTIQAWMDKDYYPGGALCVMKDKHVLFHKTYGGFTDDTQVYVASAGKWVAAATIASVVDKGKLKWNDRVDKWLPEFKKDPKGAITLKHLLSHTSGIRPYFPEPRVDNYNHLDSAVAEILPLDTLFAQGTRFQYGGLAMQIAGRMAEKASHKEFEQIFQDNIAKPLGMAHSHFSPVERSGGHAPMLAGGLCTTLHDYMAFLDMIYHDGTFGGKQVIKPQSIEEMQTDQVGEAKVLPGEYVQRALGQTHTGIYGLGEWRELVDSIGNVYQVSSPGWAGTYPWINKHDGVYGFFIAHVEPQIMNEDSFSSFYGSPVLSREVSEILQRGYE